MTTHSLRRTAILIATCAVFAAAAGTAAAQGTRTIRMVVPFAAGGPADFVARSLSEKLGPQLGGSIVIDNRLGANGSIGAQAVSKADGDGNTLLFATSGMLTISPILEKNLPYDPLKDLAPVSRVVANGTAFLVGTGIPASNIREFVQYAKSRPQPLAVGSAGTGNILHLYLELFKDAAKVDITHVPYKGIAPAVTDVIGGQIAGAFADLPIALSQIRAGKVKALGMVGTQRASVAPDIPTIAEQGFPGVDGVSWFGLLAPGKTPPALAAQLSAAVARALSDPELKQKLQALGSEPSPTTPEETVRLIQSDQARWAKVIAARRITID
jgi:tripartite-type tricarboxylate transporter receptor subunit TctC